MSTPIPCEALATKAELNELKQQINELFGRLEDDETQVKDVLNEGNLTGTLFLGSLVSGFDSVVKKVKPRINLGLKSQTNILIKNGNGKYFKSSTVEQLNKLIQANNTQATAALKQSAINASRITGLLSFLLPVLNYTLIQVQTRKLNPLIQENIDRQIASDQTLWDTTMRVFNYQNGLTEEQISSLKNQFLDNLSTQKIINDENQLTNSKLFQEIDARDVLIANLKFQIEEIKRILEEQKQENLAIAEEFGLFAGEAKERIRELEEINFTQNERIEALETQLGELEKQLNNSELDLIDSRNSLTEWELFTGTKGTDLTNLQFEFSNFDLQNAGETERENKVNETRARFTTIYDYSLNPPSTGGTGGGGGLPSNARKNIVKNQNKQIELTAKLAGIDPTTITGFPILDFQATQSTNPFGEIIDFLLPQVTPSDTTTTGDTTDVNLEEFSNNFDNKFDTIAATLAGLTATINTIDLNTNPTNLGATVNNAVCSTTAPGGCTTQNVTNPLQQGQQGISNKLNDIASTLSAAFGAGNAALNTQILNITTATNAIVAKGWASTAIDKTLNAANFALSLHNAMMLSTNIAETVLETISIVLETVGVTDANGDAINVTEWLTNKIRQVIEGIIGAQNYAELTLKLTAANRIYQAGMNIIDNVTDLIDTSMDLDEYTGENISRIGNALRDSGVVSFDAYEEMLEDLDHRKFSKWLRRLEQAEDATDDIYSIADSIKSIKDIGTELKESREEFNAAITDTQALLKEQETELDTEIDNLPEPTIEDEARG